MKNFAATIILSIAAYAEAKSTVYTSGEIKTRDTFKYGRFVTSMRGPVSKGTIASFFTAENDPNFDDVYNSFQFEVSPSFDPVVRTKVKTNLYEGEWEPLPNPYLD